MERLLKKWPPRLIRRAADGKVEINGELYDLLGERYAFQTEIETMFATMGRYYPDRPLKFGTQVTPQNYKALLAKFIPQTYNITDPAVLALKDYSVADVLLGRPFQ